MSLPRASDPFRRLPRLSSQFQQSRPVTVPHKFAPTHQDNTTSTTLKPTRSFHSTPHFSAARRSPTVRRAEASRTRIASSPPIYNAPVRGVKDGRHQFLEEHGIQLWADAQRAGLIPNAVDQQVFMRVGSALLDKAYTQAPSREAIREIHDDPDLTFNVGQVVSIGDPRFREWVVTACTLAEARFATIISATRFLDKATTAPKLSIALNRIEYLALQVRDPVSMTLHARVLILREQYNEALALIEEVMRVIRPVTTSRPSQDKHFPLDLAPWNVYEEVNRKMGNDDAADKAVETAAREYHDPQALFRLAGRHMKDGDLENYEACMSKAASTGNADACRKLANFYYLTCLGHYPRRGEDATEQKLRQQQEQQKKSWISSFFGRMLSPDDYLNLAREWYELACTHGSHDAALTMSLLLRLDGKFDFGKQYLEMAAQKPGLASAIRGYRVNWHNKELTMNVDLKRLDV